MSRSLSFLVGSTLCLSSLCATWAQGQAPKPASPTQNLPAPPGEVKPDAILKGEIRLDGRITAMTGGTGFDIKAFSFSTPDGRTIEFDEAKDKMIGGDAATRVVAGDDVLRAVPWSVVKLGFRVGVIGRDAGKDKPFRARLIVLSDYSAKYVAGRTISASAPVSLLVRKGSDAFEARNFEGALKLFQQAAAMAGGTGDRSGTVLANSWLGNAYSEMEQPEKARAAFLTAIKVAEGVDPGIAAGAMNNLGMSFLRSDQPAEAVKWLERSNTYSEGESEESQILGKRNLAGALAANKQFDRALSTWRSVLPRLRALNLPDQEASVLLGIAGALRESGQASEGKRHAEMARERIAVADPTRKGAVLGMLGSYLAEAGDKEGARAAFNEAKSAFTAQGDVRGAANVGLELAKLDATVTTPAPAPAEEAPVAPVEPEPVEAPTE